MASSIPASLPESLSGRAPQTQEISLFRRRVLSYWSKIPTRVATVVTLLLVLLTFVPVGVLPSDPSGVNLGQANLPGAWAGNWANPLGADFLGRDMLARVIAGARLTLLISGVAVVLALITGIVLGLLAGYYGHWVDEVVSWLTDVQLAFPVMALAIAILALFSRSMVGLIFVLAITSWSTAARIVRAQTLSARHEDYVDAARALGTPERAILFRHILPNVLSPVLAVAAYEWSRLVLTESALSFLGLGIAAPQITWGGMIGDGRSYVYSAPWTAAVPGFMIATLVIAFNFVSDGLRDAFDPATWTRRE